MMAGSSSGRALFSRNRIGRLRGNRQHTTGFCDWMPMNFRARKCDNGWRVFDERLNPLKKFPAIPVSGRSGMDGEKFRKIIRPEESFSFIDNTYAFLVWLSRSLFQTANMRRST